MPLKFTDASTASEVTVTAGVAAFGNTANETRIVWMKFDGTPGGTRSILSQGGGGASNFVGGATPSVSFTRDYVTTDALAICSLASLGVSTGEPICLACSLTNGAPALYGGTLNTPMREASAYSTGPTTGAGGLVDKSANPVRMGGFSGSAQGLNGSIYLVMWFTFAMTVAQINDAARNPWKYRTLAEGFWVLGAHGLTTVVDQSGHGHPGSVTANVGVGPDLFVTPLWPFPWPSSSPMAPFGADARLSVC